jgi:DNA-binding beta-propeller fold protein YncE
VDTRYQACLPLRTLFVPVGARCRNGVGWLGSGSKFSEQSSCRQIEELSHGTIVGMSLLRRIFDWLMQLPRDSGEVAVHAEADHVRNNETCTWGCRPAVQRAARPGVVKQWVLLFAITVLALPLVAGAAGEPSGLRQLAGKSGCLTWTGDGGRCTDLYKVGEIWWVARSPDGSSVYAGGGLSGNGAIGVFHRSASGRLTQLPGRAGCMRNHTRVCTNGSGLETPVDLVVSADGKNVYVSGHNSWLIGVHHRKPNGALAVLPGSRGCVGSLAAAGCDHARAMRNPNGLATSPDGKNVYAAAGEGLVVFARRTSDGSLEQLPGEQGCINVNGGRGCASSDNFYFPNVLAVSPDGRNVYGAGGNGQYGWLVSFARDRSSGALTQLSDGCLLQGDTDPGCTVARGLVEPGAVQVSRDGRNVYVASTGKSAVASFGRDRATGALTQLAGSKGCTSQNGLYGCARANALNSAKALAVAPDGRHVYVAGPHGIAAFARDHATGALRFLGCLGWRKGCERERVVNGGDSLAISPDGKTLYSGGGAWGGMGVFVRSS